MTATKCPPALLRWYKWASTLKTNGYFDLDRREYVLLTYCEKTYPNECKRKP